MNKVILTAAALLLNVHFAAASIGDGELLTTSIDRYDANVEQTIMLPTNFGEPTIIDKRDVDLLKDHTILHVDLVYTSFRTSENFDQEALNKNRIEELKSVLPQLKNDEPTFSAFEQIGAKTADEARKYFHGFVIHYGQSLDYKSLSSFLRPYQEGFKQYTVSSSEGGKIEHSSGTVIHIPSNAVTLADGTPVTGDYTIKYREFRDPADIAMSGIPMMHGDDHFSSKGMYEIRGEQAGQKLKLQKDIVVDFKATSTDKNVNFYALDDRTGEWTELQSDVFNSNDAQPEESDGTMSTNMVRGWSTTGAVSSKQWTIGDITISGEIGVKDDYMTCELNRSALKIFIEILEEQNEALDSLVIDYNLEEGQVKIEQSDFEPLFWTIYGGEDPWMASQAMTQAQEYSRGYQNYNKVVSGLRSSTFGVYNCDQTYRLSRPLAVTPNYIDAETGETIPKKVLACLMDFEFNASFSFGPTNLSFSKGGENAVLLFTGDNKIYMIKPSKFKELDLSNPSQVTIPLADVTGKVKDTKDLRQYLSI